MISKQVYILVQGLRFWGLDSLSSNSHLSGDLGLPETTLNVSFICPKTSTSTSLLVGLGCGGMGPSISFSAEPASAPVSIRCKGRGVHRQQEVVLSN